MARGTESYRWEYEEILYFDDPASAMRTCSLWTESLMDNSDYRMGRVEVFISDERKVVVRYS